MRTMPSSGLSDHPDARGQLGLPLKSANGGFAASAVTAFAACLSVLLLGMSTWLAIVYRDTPLVGLYAFRETQTALTAYWACQDGFHLAYPTPVAGFPWSIPLEFPIYQWIVALVGCSFHFPIDAVGRLVSFAFWLGCLWPARTVCRRLFGDRSRLYFWIFVALFVSAPIYQHYGRAFLPESVGLFFALVYVAFALEMSLGRDRLRDTLGCGLFLTLAILQKSTTVLPMLLLAALYPWMNRRSLWNDRLRAPAVPRWAVAYVVPLVIGIVWVKYSDQVKMANPLGVYLTSSALVGWNFGTWPARYSEALWNGVIWRRVIGTNIAGHVGAITIIAGFAAARGRSLVIGTGVALFLVFFMVFENLLFVHEYYPFSNTIYLIFALAVAIGGLVEARPGMAPLWALAFAGVIGLNLQSYFTGHLYAEEVAVFDDTNPILASARFVREHTSPADPILVYGDDWNSELPYYAQRRSFAVPVWFKPYLTPLDTPVLYLERGPGALMICGEARADQGVIGRIAANYATWPKNSLAMCDVYLKPI